LSKCPNCNDGYFTTGGCEECGYPNYHNRQDWGGPFEYWFGAVYGQPPKKKAELFSYEDMNAAFDAGMQRATK